MVSGAANNPHDAIIRAIRLKATANQVRVTQHAQQEMVADRFKLDEVLHALENGQLLENYSAHRRGACCLMGGTAPDGRSVHVVCTTDSPTLIIITVYEPKPPKWRTPTQRGA